MKGSGPASGAHLQARHKRQGEHQSERSIVVLSEEDFERGRSEFQLGINLQEGGPKGIDFDKTGSVLATTCEEHPLAFFAVSEVLGHQSPRHRLAQDVHWLWKVMTNVLVKLAKAAGRA